MRVKISMRNIIYFFSFVFILLTVNISYALPEYFIKSDRFMQFSEKCSNIVFHNLLIINLPLITLDQYNNIARITIIDKENGISVPITIEGDFLIYTNLFRKSLHKERIDSWCDNNDCAMSIYYYYNEYNPEHESTDLAISVLFKTGESNIFRLNNVEMPRGKTDTSKFIYMDAKKTTGFTEVNIELPDNLTYADIVITKAKHSEQMNDQYMRIYKNTTLTISDSNINKLDYYSIIVDHPINKAENKIVLKDNSSNWSLKCQNIVSAK